MRLGTFPTQTTLVHVGGVGADMFPLRRSLGVRGMVGAPLDRGRLSEVVSKPGAVSKNVRYKVLAVRASGSDKLAPLAVCVLQLRELARLEPERPAHEVLDADLLAMVASQADQVPALIRNLSRSRKAVVHMGGYLARKA